MRKLLVVRLDNIGDVAVPSRDYSHIEDLHLAIGHLITAWVRDRSEVADHAMTP